MVLCEKVTATLFGISSKVSFVLQVSLNFAYVQLKLIVVAFVIFNARLTHRVREIFKFDDNTK